MRARRLHLRLDKLEDFRSSNILGHDVCLVLLAFLAGPHDEAVKGSHSPTGLPTTGCYSLYKLVDFNYDFALGMAPGAVHQSPFRFGPPIA